MAQYGILDYKKLATVFATHSGHGDGGPTKKQKTAMKRKKRSIGTVVEQNVTTHSLSIVDADSISDFKLKDCTIWEEFDGKVVERHVYDFENDILIEDRKVGSGSTLTATYIEDGIEKESEKKVSQDELITVVLRPL